MASVQERRAAATQSPSYAAASAPERIRATAAATVARQGGTATARQLTEWHWSSDAIGRRAAAGLWQRLHRGVFLLHSGPRTWREQAHGAILYAGRGAALSHASAAYAHRITDKPGPVIHVSVPGHRTVRPSAGLTIHRRTPMPASGGRLRAIGEDATVLDMLQAATGTDAAVALLAAAMLRGLLPDRILWEATTRRQLRHRSLLAEMLSVGSDAIESPLEYRYARDVERAHRLPRGVPQVRHQIDGRWIRADRVYVGLGTRVELDGQLAHPFGATDDDVWRDNAVLLARREVTLRYRWSHVAVSPCATATQVAAALAARGWAGELTPCPQCPPADRRPRSGDM